MGIHSSALEILQRQKRNWIIDSFTIDEGNTKPYPYSLGKIQIENDFSVLEISGSGVDEDPKGILQINSNTGEITVHGPVDHEKYPFLKLSFEAFDKRKNAVDTRLGIEIEVIDTNDNPPKFELEKYEITIKESKLQGTELITLQAKDDDSTTNNKMFDLKIVSVTPKPQDLEFYLKQIQGSQIGIISFKGCLDHEKTEKYTIIVEAKDHGEPENLSSSCTVIINVEDGNNHLPVITGQTGPGKVKEGQENVLVSRLQVTDKDTKGTAAWGAKYHIQGDTMENFRITTDSETNEGLLYVEKALDYEDSPLKNVTVVVENDMPYFSCNVVSRSTTGLWKVATFSASTGSSGTGETLSLSYYHMTVTVEDVNEGPVFDQSNKQVTLVENVAVGQYLETFTAKDPDVKSANTCVYMIGEDPADWVTVDPVTGEITTSKILDRESAFVKDNIYTITVYAVDNGKPPMTGTATLSIFISDENDNVPSLNVSTIDMCQSSGPSLAEITAFDLDGDPYGGPFQFKLIGDVEGLWKVDPDLGNSVNLVKENTVHSGHYELFLKVSDRQGETAVHNLSVTVCNCLDTARPNCRFRKVSGSKVGGGAFGIIFFSMLMFAGILLLAFLVSCKKETILLPVDCTDQHLMTCNTERPGTDCKMLYTLQAPGVELGDYAPHVYAEEGDSETNFELDDIPIPDIPFDPELDLDLDAKFTTLATICMANDTTTYSEKNFYVMKNIS
ncbi:cadherin-2-like [Scomber japonicus]|uniref:cadherin-2-like n=1 Tax=Scomber japonicus TaxID=13676 RepID=UPI0023054D22|nr:cadherin-2-like [Scomber japonicus]